MDILLLGVIGALMIICIFLIIANRRYTRIDGKMIITSLGEKKTFTLEIDKDPAELADKTYIVFEVVDETLSQ